jgi:hypothetical protein
MHRAKLFGALFLFIVAALFVYGVTRLLILRFEKGDVYPPYSSYRSDPLGTKAFYEALSLLRGVETMRQIEPLQGRSGLSDTTFFLFGLRAPHFSALQQGSVKVLEEGALGGGRIVISFVPTHDQPAPPSREKKKVETPQEDADKEKDEEEELLDEEVVDLTKRWGVKAEVSVKVDAEANLSIPEKELPSSLPWHSTLVFEPQDPAWRIIYTRAEKPVVIERSYGKGSILLSSDSFFLSNEAMKSERYPKLLSWLCGPHRKIVFDETHLGVSKSPGVAALLRKYGLAPFFISLIVLALLAIWKQAARLVPVYEEEEATVDAGKDAFTGFTKLLRRNIPPDHILSACLEEWKRSFTHGKQDFSSLLPRIQEIIAADRAQPKKDRNPVQAYRKISALGMRRRIVKENGNASSRDLQNNSQMAKI